MKTIKTTLELVSTKLSHAGNLTVRVKLHNTGDEDLVLDLYQMKIPSLVLEMVDTEGKSVSLLPPPVPIPEEERPKLDLNSGKTYEWEFRGFVDSFLPAGDYKIIYHYTANSQDKSEINIIKSEWITVHISRSLSEPILPVKSTWSRWKEKYFLWFCRILCIIRKWFGIKKRCDKVRNVEVNRQLTETISNATPGNQAWNGTYGWSAKFNLALDQTKCTVTVTVRIRINGAITNAQRNAWENEIEKKWSNTFKLCCKDKCCSTCCPKGYAIICDVQFVGNNEHQVVNAGASTPNMGNWGTGDTVDITHEFGHMLGAKDEYFTVDGVNYGTWRQANGNVMNNPANTPVPKHFYIIKEEAEKLIRSTNCTVVPINQAC